MKFINKTHQKGKSDIVAGLFFKFLFSVILLCGGGLISSAQTYVSNTGAGTTLQTSPFNEVTYGNGSEALVNKKIEMDYQLADFGSTNKPVAGYIKKIYFRFTLSKGVSTYANFNILMGQSSAALSGSGFSTGLKTVYSSQMMTINATAGVWYPITLQSPFLYDPNKILIVQISHTGSTGGLNIGYVNAATTTSRHRVYAVLASDPTGLSNDQQMYDFGMDITPSSVVNVNAGVTQLVSPTAFCAGTYSIAVRTANLGASAINPVTVNWSFDGTTQTPLTWAYSIPSGRDTVISLGNKLFNAGVAHNLKVWTTNPNNTTDADHSDDTLIVNNISPALAGNYTINPSGSGSTNFTTFAAAVAALNAYGICSPVKITIAPGSYNEQVSLDNVQGTSPTNTVTFDGLDSTKVFLGYTSTVQALQHTFRINGSNYITLKRMSISNTGSICGIGIHITALSNYNTVSSCIVKVANNTTTVHIITGIAIGGYGSGSDGAAIYTEGNFGNYNTLNNNIVDGGWNNIFLGGPNQSTFCYGNVVTNNRCTNGYYGGIYPWMQSNCLVQNNHITTRPTTTYTPVALYLIYSQLCTVDGNVIDGVANYGFGSAYCDFVTKDPTLGNTITNNMILTTYYGLGYGINLNTVNYAKVYHNTVYYTAPSGYAFYITAGSANDVRDNIAYKTSSNAYCFYNTAAAQVSNLDYNDYFSLGGTYCYNAGAYGDLPAFQKAYPLLNQHSSAADPGFNSLVSSSVDLHMCPTCPGISGTYLNINKDIDGDLRCKLAPNMGADETLYGKSKPIVKFYITSNIYPGSPSYVYQTAKAGEPKVHQWYLINATYLTYTKISDSVVLFTNKFTVGSNTLKLVTQSCGGNDSFIQTFTLKAPLNVPVTDFVANKNSILVNEIVSFQDLSTNGPTTWTWSVSPDSVIVGGAKVPAFKYVFGNNKFQNPQIQFLFTGKYQVCLSTFNSVGKGVAVCKKNYITVLPTVNIGTAKVTDAQGYLFDDGGPNAPYINGGGNPSTLIAPCADSVYLVFSQFDVNCGIGFVQLYEGTNSSGKRLDPCGGAGLTSGFTGGSSSAPCAILCMPNVNKPDTFKAKTSMFIQMTDGSTANNAKGFSAYWWSKPASGKKPKAGFTTNQSGDSICVNTNTNFTNTTTASLTDPATILWDLDGDPTTFECTGTCSAAFWPYFLTGPVTITLIATNCGGADTFIKTLTVYNPKAPKAAIKADNTTPTTNDIVFFSAPIAQCVEDYKWTFVKSPFAGNGTGVASFANGTSSISASPQVNFSDTGYYDVKLFVDNLSATQKDSITVLKYIHVRSPYCIPSVATLNQGIGISKVVFNTISNSTQQAFKDYSNFTTNQSLSTSVALGATYPLIVNRVSTLLFEPLIRTVYIDWDQDGSFSGTNETVARDSNSFSTSWTTKITIPKNAKLGATVMRIAVNRGSYSNKPCGQNEFGEYQDYRLYIIPYNIPPVITLKGTQGLLDTIKMEQGAIFTDPGYSANSFLYGDMTPFVKRTSRKAGSTKIADSFNNILPNVYVFSYNVTDSTGNKAITQYRVVQITKDHTPPKLIVSKPDTTIMEVTSTPITPFPAPKVISADDLIDGPLASSVVDDAANVTSNILGFYIITYSVADLSGNTSYVYRYVKIIDTLNPSLTLKGNTPVNVEVFYTYTDAGVKTSDNYYPQTSLDKLVKINSDLDTSKLGSYSITYNLTDPSGNKAASITRVVNVIDTLKPQIYLNGNSADTMEVFTKYADAGVTLSDNYDTRNNLSLVVTGTFYSNFPVGSRAGILGSYTIIYTATDKSGNHSSVTRTIWVIDTKPPVITLKGNESVAICRWFNYQDAGFDVSDNYDIVKDVRIDTIGTFYPNGATIQGIYTIRFKATDKSGNIGISNARTIWVKPADDFTCLSGVEPGLSLDKYISVYPNPSTGLINIKVNFPDNSINISRLNITNLLGQTLWNPESELFNDQDNLNHGNFQADLTNQPDGIYFINVTSGAQTITWKIVLSRQ